MADPTGVSIAFDSDTLDPTPTWTRIDDPDGERSARSVASWEFERGRSTELDKTDTGTASIGIADTTGAFDPTNPSSPYYGDDDTNLNPMRQAAICLWNPDTQDWWPRFRGFVDEWQGDWDLSTRVNAVTVGLVDGFAVLADLEMTAGNVGDTPPDTAASEIYFVEDTDLFAAQTRINKALDAADWPSAWRTEIFTGNVKLQGTVYARRDSLLSVLLDTADAEFPGVANVFMDAQGGVVFHGRFARFNPEDVEYHIRRWKVTDGTTALEDADNIPVAGLPYRRSRSDIINAALALPQNVSETDVPGQLSVDTASKNIYGWRSVSYDNLATLGGRDGATAIQETKKFADYYKDNYADPRTRVTQLRFVARDHRSFNGPALWEFLCKVEISDIVALHTVHPGGGGFDEDFFVEGLHYTCSPGQTDPDTGEQQMPQLEVTVDVSPRAYYDTNPFGDEP